MTMLWMGAAAGSEACIANVIRIGLRYNNTSTLEHGYGISLFPLASFAIDTYGDDPCERFLPPEEEEGEFTSEERILIARMHKAITLLQLSWRRKSSSAAPITRWTAGCSWTR